MYGSRFIRLPYGSVRAKFIEAGGVSSMLMPAILGGLAAATGEPGQRGWAKGPIRKGGVTRRLRQQVGVDCQSMPTSHAAVRHGVSWGKARRAEHAFLREWDDQRPRRRSRYLGADEIHRGKKQSFSRRS